MLAIAILSITLHGDILHKHEGEFGGRSGNYDTQPRWILSDITVNCSETIAGAFSHTSSSKDMGDQRLELAAETSQVIVASP